MNTATNATTYDLKTKEGAQAAAESVLGKLGQGWASRLRESGKSWSFRVYLKKDGRKVDIEVTPDLSQTGKYTAWIEAAEYSDSSTSSDPAEAVANVRAALKAKIENLQDLLATVS